MSLPIMATPAKINGRSGGEEDMIGCMGSMTDRAIVLHYRIMFYLRPFAPFYGVSVTRVAKVRQGSFQKPFLFCGMGAMATQTTCFAK
jgi:hypothetical protein